MSNQIGKTIREIRERMGYTRDKVSFFSGIKEKTIFNIESGRILNPKRSTLVDICAAMDIDYALVEKWTSEEYIRDRSKLELYNFLKESAFDLLFGKKKPKRIRNKTNNDE